MKNENYIKAVIDIGTNSCRMFVAKVEEKNGKIQIIKKIYKETKITKLGNFINENSLISETGMDKLISVIKNYNKKIKEYKATKIVAFATSAIREAKNKKEIKEKILIETGINVEIISGNKEGEITFLGAAREFKGKILLVDIGGGSTEFIFGERNKIEYVKSFKLGAVRETRKYFKDDNYEKIEDCIESIRSRIEEIKQFKNENFLLVAVAGTITTSVSVFEKMEIYNSEVVHKYVLTEDNLKENLNLFLSKNLEERKKIIGLQPQRGENVISGTLIILKIMELLKKKEIIASECDGLEGAMVSMK